MRELFQVWPSALTSEQINDITATALSQPSTAATLFTPRDAIDDIRSCSVRWLSEPWIKDLLWPYVQEANRLYFNVDIDGQAEMQFTEYRGEASDHYDWHHDVNWHGQTGSDRKLSITVQLSEADAYAGGDFEFEEVQTTANFRSKGTILVFPSYLRHRIHPVTSGSRRALVAWFSGPRWA